MPIWNIRRNNTLSPCRASERRGCFSFWKPETFIGSLFGCRECLSVFLFGGRGMFLDKSAMARAGMKKIYLLSSFFLSP
ncbi:MULTISPECIES: hypothetical protein [unclassified Bacteroides]|uniref:hypothetical protein n=1 Tax=unclassified Bacteroides TaxID=2646097 RepID=UPI000E9D27B4|nr:MULTISPECIES: hypothetical protein [unclassified Bacteroides]RGN51444.1 hypothetical protein DXB63_01605 [Bacteroides sp. OM05-12]RHR78027.1 hypothetical protein DWW69_05050 [Bacteroides sp. AF16-49]